MFAVHPGTDDFYERYARGERVLWLAPMHFLFCFSKGYEGDPDAMVWDWCPYGFELAYPFDEKGRWSKGVVSAIKFDSLGGQLSKGNLLEYREADESFCAESILADILAWCAKRKGPIEPKYEEMISRGRTFLQKEQFLIQKHIWVQALPQTRH